MTKKIDLLKPGAVNELMSDLKTAAVNSFADHLRKEYPELPEPMLKEVLARSLNGEKLSIVRDENGTFSIQSK